MIFFVKTLRCDFRFENYFSMPRQILWHPKLSPVETVLSAIQNCLLGNNYECHKKSFHTKKNLCLKINSVQFLFLVLKLYQIIHKWIQESKRQKNGQTIDY